MHVDNFHGKIQGINLGHFDSTDSDSCWEFTLNGFGCAFLP